MAISPYTLTDLYNKRLIDYVPMDLCTMPAMYTMTPAMNPYLSMAQSGNLYQKYGDNGDIFTSTSHSSVNNRWGGWAYNTTEPGSRSDNFRNMFGLDGTGSYYQGDAAMNIGAQNGMDVFSMHGGTGNLKSNVSDGIDKLLGVSKKVLNIAATLLVFGTGYLLLKKGKKPKQPKTGFNWSKLNPLNWFKKDKTK